MDATTEWFPALTGRISATTVQGYEWFPDRGFANRVQASIHIRECLVSRSPLKCIETFTATNEILYDYVYITDKANSSVLVNELFGDNDYVLVHQLEDVFIFKVVFPVIL